MSNCEFKNIEQKEIHQAKKMDEVFKLMSLAKKRK